MILAKILGRAFIPIMDSAEVAAWLAENPLQDDVVIDSSRNCLAVSDGDGGATYTDVKTVFADDIDPNTGTATYTWQADKGILSFFKNHELLRVVGAAPSNATEVQYDSTTGDLTLYTGETFNGEWVHIVYDNFPTI